MLIINRKSLLSLFILPLICMTSCKPPVQTPVKAEEVPSTSEPTKAAPSPVAPAQPQASPSAAQSSGGPVRTLKTEPIQKALLLDGLQELLVEASGEGTLTLSVGPQGAVADRELAVSETGGLYGLTFVGKPGVESVQIETEGSVSLKSATLSPASDLQKQQFKQRQKEIEQFGFFHTSYQRPEPGQSSKDLLAVDPKLPAMREVVVLDDAMATETVHARNTQRLRDWLASNGAIKLDTAGLIRWMEERINGHDAYGTSVLLSYGSTPMEVAFGTTKSALWYRYLKAGGRIVNIGDLPFYTVHSTMLQANPLPMVSAGLMMPLDLMKLPYGWNQPLWGKSVPLTRTDFGKAWGMQNGGVSKTGFPPDRLTMPLYTYKTPDGHFGSSVWFKNLNAAMPWSGYVQLSASFDAAQDLNLGDVWRGLNFVGSSLQVPDMPPPFKPVADGTMISMAASGMANRRVFVPGEEISFKTVDASDLYLSGPGLKSPIKIPATWDSSNYATGTYHVSASPDMQSPTEFVLSGLPKPEFGYQMWAEIPANKTLGKAIARQIADWGMQAYLAGPSVENMDILLEAGIPTSLRLMPVTTPRGLEISWEKTPEFYRLNIDRTPIPYAFDGGRPTPGITRPEVAEEMALSMKEQLRPYKNHPAFMGLVISNDDFSTKYGWDFSPHLTELFKSQTGLDAPSAKPVNQPPGIIPNNDPWLQWNLFSYYETNGRIVHKQQLALDEELPGTRLMPIPGGMVIPLVQAWTASQYPPLNFGKNGAAVIGSYYYNAYWQPQATVSYWMEVGRMGNRSLDQWTMPDCYIAGGGAYVRNNLFHSLAAGVRGLTYFRYEERRDPQWQELKALSTTIRAVEPIQARLQSADRRVALLLSVTTLCFDDQHAINLAYVYHNLTQAGYSVDIIAEEEIAAGAASAYKAIVLSGTNWLSQGTFDKLAAFAASGGTVLYDTSVKLDLPWAKNLGIDLNDSRGTYGNVDKISAVRLAMSHFVPSSVITKAADVTMSTFEAGRTPYAWFVNNQTGDEYRYCVSKAVSSVGKGAGSLASLTELWDWEKQQTDAGPFKTSVQLPDRALGVAYDIVGQKRLQWDESGLHLEMARFGGSLVAFLKEPITQIKIAAPAEAVGGKEVVFEAQLAGGKGTTIDATMPVRFELTAPDGTQYWDNRFVASEAGVARFAWTPAVNDLPGRWTIKASQPAANVEITRNVELASR